MTINALQEKRQTLIATATEMANDEKSSVADIKSVIAQADDCLARIEAIKQLGELAPVAKATPEMPAWKTFGSVKASDVFRGNFDEANYKAYVFGRHLLHLRGDKKSTNWLKEHGHIKANNEGTESAGGYTVPVITNADLIYLREQYGVVRQNAKVYTMTTDSTLVPNLTGSSTVYHVAENVAITTSDFTFDQVLLQTIKLGAVNPVSKELSEDTIIDYASMAARDFALKLATQEDIDCIMGDGTATYGGINGCLNTIFTLQSAPKANIASLVQADTGSVAANKPTLANLRKMVAKAPMYPGANYKWYMHKQFWFDCVAPLLDALGGNSILDIANAYGGTPTLYGYPVIFSQVMPRGFVTGAVTKPLAMFADLTLGTAFGDRRGITIEMSDQTRFLEDQYLYKATERFAFKCFDTGNVTATVTDQVAGAVIVLSQQTT